jgi:DNA-damage-inducible protein J
VLIKEATMASHTAMLHVRIDEDTKAQATEALDAMGLSVSDAVRLFLRRVVVDQQFPLELKVPNAETRAAMAEAEEMIKAQRRGFATADELFEALEESPEK